MHKVRQQVRQFINPNADAAANVNVFKLTRTALKLNLPVHATVNAIAAIDVLVFRPALTKQQCLPSAVVL